MLIQDPVRIDEGIHARLNTDASFAGGGAKTLLQQIRIRGVHLQSNACRSSGTPTGNRVLPAKIKDAHAFFA